MKKMKDRMKNNRKKQMLGFVVLFVLLFSFGLDAQPTGPTNSPTPFGFLEALMIGGAAMGARSLSKLKK